MHKLEPIQDSKQNFEMRVYFEIHSICFPECVLFLLQDGWLFCFLQDTCESAHCFECAQLTRLADEPIHKYLEGKKVKASFKYVINISNSKFEIQPINGH